MFYILTVLGVLLFSISSLSQACDKLSLKNELKFYTQGIYEIYIELPNSFVAASEALIANHKLLNSYVLNKNEMTQESLTSLQEFELEVADLGDSLYDQQEVLLEGFGEIPTPNNLYGKTLNCFPDQQSSLQLLLQNHVLDTALDDSNISSIFNTFYKYSDLLKSFSSDLSSWIDDNKNNSVPESSQFDDLLDLDKKVTSANFCAQDLLNLTFANWCEVLLSLDIKEKKCGQPLFSEVGDCL